MSEEQKNEGFVERLRNSPRTVSTIIVILIIAGAIFAFSDRKQAEVSPTASATPEAPEQLSSAEPTKEAESGKNGKVDSAQATPMPKAEETNDAYVEVATKGQGITQMARLATKRYIEANEAYKNLSNEQKIYVEDYLKDQIKRQPITVGKQVTFSKEAIKKGIEASQKLSDAQIKNLQKYAQRVKWN